MRESEAHPSVLADPAKPHVLPCTSFMRDSLFGTPSDFHWFSITTLTFAKSSSLSAEAGSTD